MTIATTMLDVLDAQAHTSERGFTFLDYQLNPDFWSFERLVAEARRRAVVFAELGLSAGDRIALMQPDVREFVLSFFAAIAGGMVPVPMYPLVGPRASKEFLATASSILTLTEARLLIADILPAELAQVAQSAGVTRCVDSKSIADAKTSHAYVPPSQVTPDAACFLQFTSGSTRSPKGVHVSHANLLANSHAIMIEGLRCDPLVDRPVCWLPLYHDMGLIGHVIAPFTIGMSVVFIPTLAFIARPGVWMESVHKYRGSIVFGPNFALALATRRPPDLTQLDLSCLRVVGCGAEPIHADTLRNFLGLHAACGLRAEAIMPCYGLAEATLAVAFESLERPARIIAIDRERYESEGVAHCVTSDNPRALELASCGQAFPQHEIAIMDESGSGLPETHVGEIGVRGPSITPGYFRDPDATREQRHGEWLLTGDRGFLLDGDLFVCGRKKDLLIVDGRNYYPQALEWAVEELPSVRRGGVVAFSVSGAETEAVVVVAETRHYAKPNELAREIRQHLRSSIGLLPKDVVLVKPGRLPKTSSGKLQRQKAKQMYAAGSFREQISAVAPGA